MAIEVQCTCGRRLKARDEFAGKRGECRFCGRLLEIPSHPGPAETPASADAGQTAAATSPGQEAPMEITEFLDPPAVPVAEQEKAISLRPMLEALLDPRSIQWMLILGGGLTVLGLIIWMATWGVFENPQILAVALGIGTLALLGVGWLIRLKTRFKVAGQAITFLACVVAPLNLWFYYSYRADLAFLGDNLWIGGLVCCLLYAGTVWVLRDPLFMYAVEAGVALTVGLLVAELGMITEASAVSMFLMALGLISIHAERAFPPEAEHFTRQRFGLPLFWSGHVLLGASLLILLGVQAAGWLVDPIRDMFGTQWQGNLLTQWSLLAGGLWLAGTYAYLYSDIVVRRVGIYTCVAAFCFLLAEVTIVGQSLRGEGIIAVLTLTAIGAIAVQSYVAKAKANERLNRAVPPLGMALSILPILIGLSLHIRATSPLAIEMSEKYGWVHQTGWWFVAVMVLAAGCNRMAAYLYRQTAPKWSTGYFFLSAAALIVAAAGLLRGCGLEAWTEQAPLLMIIPLAYMVASRLWRGHTPSRPLYGVAQTATAVILVHGLAASMESLELVAHPVQQQMANLLLGVVFLEAAVFYILAATFRPRSANIYFATAAACAALWQLLGYLAVPGAYHTMMYAALGVGFLAIARSLGLEQVPVYRSTGAQVTATRGRGLPAYQTGNAIVIIALLAAFLQGLQGLMEMDGQQTEWRNVFALVLTAIASGAAACLVPRGAWRRIYTVTTIGLAGVLFLTLNLLVNMNGWQKLEIFCVVVGLLLIGISYVGRFREATREENEMVTFGLWLGSILATMPLLIAAVYYRVGDSQLSMMDEIAILCVTIVMLVTGYSWQIKSTTFFGGFTLVLYLVIFLVSLGWQRLEEEWVVGVFLAVGGGLVFTCGIALSIYRERLLELPERIAKREGIFRIIAWR